MDEEQHGGRKSSTNHPHELYIFMRPCGWEYHTRTSMKKQHCGWQISTNNPRGVNICMHPSGSQKHMDDEISLWMKYFDESSAWTLHLYASMRMWESQMHMDEEIVLWTKYFNETSTWSYNLCIHVHERITNAHGWINIVLDVKMTNHPRERNICMHPCGWENHKPTSMKKQRCGRNSSTNHPHGYICMHPCGWEIHKRTWMKKHCIGGKNRWIIHVNQTFVCIHVDERIRNAHGLKKQRVDEIVRQIIEMDFTFVYIPVDGDSGSRSRMTWSPGWHKKSFLANEKRNESSVNIYHPC